MLSRRQFIKAGIAGTAALVLARAAYGPFESDPQWPGVTGRAYQVLSPAGCGLIAAIAAVLLDGALPQAKASREQAIAVVVQGVDKSIAALQPVVQAELQQLFSLLNFPVSRRLLAGVAQPWLQAQPAEIAAFLENWRDSRFALLRSGFHGLHQLILAAWYGSEEAWQAIGFSLPAQVLLAQQTQPNEVTR